MIENYERIAEEEYFPHPVSWGYDDMHSYWKKKDVSFEELSEDQRVNLIHFVNFRIWDEPDGLAVQDLEGADLGDIESVLFKDTLEICHRIEHYFDDYFKEY